MTFFASLPLLEANADWHHHGGWWIAWPVFWIAVVATVGYLIYRSRRRRPHDAARSILAERFARGELSGEEYRERLSELS